jgi:hypothetical protein
VRSQAERQCARRRVAAVAAVALATLALAARGESTVGTTSADARIDFRIVIPRAVRAQAVAQQAFLAVAREDLERGYVDLPAASTLRITSNSPAGFGVLVSFDRHIVSRVVVRIRGQALDATVPGSAMQVQAPRMSREPVRVGYRLFLAPGLQPGRFAWPVALTVGTGA